MAETTEQYRNRINQLKTNIENEPYMKNMRPDIAEGISKTGNRQADIEVRQIDLENDFAAVQRDASSANPSGAEVAVARGGYGSLDERLDAEEEMISDHEFQLAQLDQKKANQIFVDTLQIYFENKFESIMDGSPRGVFDTYDKLVEAYPTSTKGVFVVNSDDNWYFWLEGFGWTSGGVYQSTKLSENGATSFMRSPVGNYGIVQSTQEFNVDSINKILKFPTSGSIQVLNKTASVDVAEEYTSYSLDISMNGNVGGWLVFDTEDNKFKTVYLNSINRITETCILLGSIRWSAKPKLILNFKYTLDSFEDTFDVSSDNMSKNFAFPWITSAEAIEILPETKTIKFPNNSQIRFMNGLKTINLATKYRNTEVDISWGGETQGWLFYNTKTDSLKSVYEGSMAVVDNYDIPLLSVWWNTLKIDCNFYYRINGYASGKRGNFLNQKLIFAGDSLTDGATDGSANPSVKTYGSFVKEFLAFASYTQDGIRGSTLAVRAGQTDSGVERCGSWTETNVLGMCFGMNDFTRGVPLGTPESTDTSDFYGALNYVLPTVLQNNPNAKVFFITPPKNNKESSNPSFKPNAQGLLQKDYVAAILERCDYYSVPVLDMYKEGGMSPFISSVVTKYRPDKLHYNESGYKEFARIVASFIETL